jgi:hypothetical protein
MNPLLSLLASLALLVPFAGGSSDNRTGLLPEAEGTPAAVSPRSTVDPSTVPSAAQVRIEQRVIVRIAPPGTRLRESMVPEMAPLEPPQVSERKMGKCVSISGIAAVQPDAGGNLLLFMRDRRLVSARLEKACRARDFYSGFYLERTRDGMLCVDRDKLHSRAGSNCAISRMRQIVVNDD